MAGATTGITVNSVFNSFSQSVNTASNNLQTAIENANKDIEDYKKLIDFLTVYHGQVAIQKFKSEKARNYLKLLH